MVRTRMIAALGVLAICTGGAGTAAAAKKKPTHTAAKAAKVVKAEIADRYLHYGEYSPDKPVQRSASCSPLTKTLFKCTWMAESAGTQTFGKAKVKFYAKGNETTFSDVSCGMNYDNPDEIAAEVAADMFCDEDPHN